MSNLFLPEWANMTNAWSLPPPSLPLGPEGPQYRAIKPIIRPRPRDRGVEGPREGDATNMSRSSVAVAFFRKFRWDCPYLSWSGGGDTGVASFATWSVARYLSVRPSDPRCSYAYFAYCSRPIHPAKHFTHDIVAGKADRDRVGLFADRPARCWSLLAFAARLSAVL